MPRHLALNLTAGIHPLAMGKLVLDVTKFTAFANDYMRHLRYPVTREVPSEIWEEKYAKCAAFLTRDCRLAPSEWEDIVPPRDRDCEAYCPRCHSPFLRADALCRTCGGLATKPFPGVGE